MGTKKTQRYTDKDVKYSSLRDDYKTPPSIYKMILEIFARYEFDIDVACSEHNIPAKYHFTKLDNGLVQEWTGLCFCNPPWKDTKAFIKKACESKNAITCFVVASDRFYVKYMQDSVINNPNAVFLTLPQKQGFIIPGQEDKPPVASVGAAIIFITQDCETAEDIKNIINIRKLFNTTAFRGGGINENIILGKTAESQKQGALQTDLCYEIEPNRYQMQFNFEF